MPTPKKDGSPLPVEVQNEEPLKVEIDEPESPVPIKSTEGNLTLPPTTTEQEDLVTAGQRNVNLIWESTQALIAITITFAIVGTAFTDTDSSNIVNAFFLIIGFYFSRTNHQAIGGVGKKPALGPYQGR